MSRLQSTHMLYISPLPLSAHPLIPACPAQEVPLLGQLLLSGGQQHGAERRWLAALLVAGARGAEDAGLYRRKHAFELAMAACDSIGAGLDWLHCTASHCLPGVCVNGVQGG